MKRERPDTWMLWHDILNTIIDTKRPPLSNGFLKCYSRNSSQLEMEYTDLLVVSRHWANESLSRAEFNDDIYKQCLKIVPENPSEAPHYLSPSMRDMGLKRQERCYLDQQGNKAAYVMTEYHGGYRREEIFLRYNLLKEYAEKRGVCLLWCVQCARSSELYPKELGITTGSRSLAADKYNLEINIFCDVNSASRLQTTCGVIGKVLIAGITGRNQHPSKRRSIRQPCRFRPSRGNPVHHSKKGIAEKYLSNGPSLLHCDK